MPYGIIVVIVTPRRRLAGAASATPGRADPGPLLGCQEESCSAGDEFDLEAVGVDEVGGIVVLAAGVGVGLGEQQRPAMGRPRRGEGVDAGPVARVEREMVHPRPEPVVAVGGKGG